MSIERLEQVIETKDGKPQIDNSAHPMRKVTELIAQNDSGWTQEVSDEVAELFGSRASEWNLTRHEYTKDPIRDALARANLKDTQTALEIGCGTGIYTSTIKETFDRVISIDLTFNMLKECSNKNGFYIQADSMRMPFRDNSISAVVLINCFLFKTEVLRVLKANGKILWISTSGESTPIYLSPEQLDEMFPNSTIRTSPAGWGSWCSIESIN